MVSGPLGIDPLHFTFTLLFFLALFVIYLLLPKGYRVEYFRAYPKRYAWSARSRLARRSGQQRMDNRMLEPQLRTGRVALQQPPVPRQRVGLRMPTLATRRLMATKV